MDKRMRKLGVDKITASYLNLQSTKENRGNVVGFSLLFLNFSGLLPLIAEPFVYSLFIIGFIPAMIMNLWAILYVVDPYRFELSYYLYFGLYGFVNTFVLSLALVKILYFDLGVSGVWPFIILLVIINSLPFLMNWLNYKMLYAGTYAKLQNKKDWKIPTFFLLPPASGYFLYQFVDSYGSPSAVMILFFICLFMLTIFTAYFSTNVHKYFFLKNNMDIVLQVYPRFGKPKHIQYAEEIEKKRRKKMKKKKEKNKKR